MNQDQEILEVRTVDEKQTVMFTTTQLQDKQAVKVHHQSCKNISIVASTIIKLN